MARTVLVRRWRALAATSERGALSLEWAWLSLVTVPLTFLGVQVGMWFQARDLCQAAAQSGVATARILNAQPGSGASTAAEFLRDVGGSSVSGGHTSESVTAATVSVSCTATAIRVIPVPGLDFTVTQSATAQRERFTTPASDFGVPGS